MTKTPDGSIRQSELAPLIRRFRAKPAPERSVWKVPIDGGEPVQVIDKLPGVPEVSVDGQLNGGGGVDKFRIKDLGQGDR